MMSDNSLAVKDEDITVYDTACDTYSKKIEIRYKWTLHEFDVIDGNVERLDSSVFPSTTNKNVNKWFLCLKKQKLGDQNRDYISLYIYQMPENKPNIFVRFSFCIIDKDGEKCYGKQGSVVFKKEDTGYGFNQFIECDELSLQSDLYVPNKNLTILCEMTIMESIIHISTDMLNNNNATIKEMSANFVRKAITE